MRWPAQFHFAEGGPLGWGLEGPGWGWPAVNASAVCALPRAAALGAARPGSRAFGLPAALGPACLSAMVIGIPNPRPSGPPFETTFRRFFPATLVG